MGHSCGTLLWDTLAGDSCASLLRDTLVGNSCGTLLWDTLVGHSCCGTFLLWDALLGHSCGTLLSRRLPATRRVYTSMFRAPQWHGASQTHFPPMPLKSAWRCDITDVISPHGPPPTRSKHITRYRQSSRSPATRRVYTSMFRAPQWHGATQRHFPPRPRDSAWHCDITDVISPHGLPTHTRSKHITRYHQSSRSPATRRVYASMFRAPQWHGATQTHFPPTPCKSAGHRRGFESPFESAKRAFRTRLPPKVTRTVSKTSASHKTSSKSHASSLQVFVRDFLHKSRVVRYFLKNSRVKVCKTSVSYETSSKSQAETPIGAHTSSSPAK